MNIITIDYSMATQSMDIFFSGCRMGSHCPGCHNSEAWDFNAGSEWTKWINKIKDDIRTFSGMTKRIFILGGEPLDQDHDELEKFLTTIFTDSVVEQNMELWLFTRYEIDQVPDRFKHIFHYIKTGPYREELTVPDNISHGVRLATSNQRVLKKGVDY